MNRGLWLIVAIMGITNTLWGAQVSVLCYHTFLGKPKIYTDFSLTELKQHIDTLQSHHMRFLTQEQFDSGHYTGTKNVLIIIDDGNISGYKAYQSVLKPAHIQPIFAIYPNIISHVGYAMTWDQLRELLVDHCGMACHGFYHLFLTEKFAQKDPKGFNQEIVRSKQILENKLGIKINYFVYPFGVVSPVAKTTIQKTGYRYAFSLKAKPTEIHEDPFDMPRYMMTRSMAKSILKQVTQ